MRCPSSNPVQRRKERVAAIVLAAGGARRLGKAKQLLPFGQGTLLQHVLDALLASPLDQIVLVLGAYAEAIEGTLAPYCAQPRLQVVRNPLWEEGLSSSVRAGLAALEPSITAALFVLADQPNITADLIAQILAHRVETGARLVAPAWRGQQGNPVLFDRSLFAELAAVTGDQGGRQIVAKYESELETVPVAAPDVFLDIDTPSDYQSALRIWVGYEKEQILSKQSAPKRLTDIHHLLVDMDGVLYRGMQPLPGSQEFLAFVQRQGLPFLLITNNSTLTPRQYVEKLQGMGVSVPPEAILTSAQATAMQLATMIPSGASLYVIGEGGLQAALREGGYRLATQDVAAVVVGMDRGLTYEKLKVATLAIRAGAHFIGTNPDLTYPAEEGIVPGNGATLAALQAATGIQPLVIGKPEAPIFEMALARLRTSPGNTAMIGDQLATDILGGQRAGLMTILILTGITKRAELETSSIRPDWVFEDLPSLQRIWEAETRSA